MCPRGEELGKQVLRVGRWRALPLGEERGEARRSLPFHCRAFRSCPLLLLHTASRSECYEKISVRPVLCRTGKRCLGPKPRGSQRHAEKPNGSPGRHDRRGYGRRKRHQSGRHRQRGLLRRHNATRASLPSCTGAETAALVPMASAATPTWNTTSTSASRPRPVIRSNASRPSAPGHAPMARVSPRAPLPPANPSQGWRLFTSPTRRLVRRIWRSRRRRSHRFPPWLLGLEV